MAISQNKNVGYSAYKVRRIIDLIRLRPVSDAKLRLNMLGTPAAIEILKILNSAIANAVNKDSANEEDLIISKVFADAGPRMKRFKPKARGRAGAFDRPSSHITIEVNSEEV
ncbi:MAG: 50S ribosomal protein L22 [Dehalococcoidia bacterium]|jgi:large subunit ribosomal protein L22|nr:50S ribosomal protein L22 [Chloroflexota bacterium]OUW95929.1 MAG: 50S ribosomal protein L22 [Chloroflexi bacterium TMED230]RZP13080.1 MAG: 50S ribosomal protein L22 [Chloroflexota bacterium]|tara:strand:- start:16614 stop:16949 length:336 start_codon:yes stop_codon:yes gene_type:complete